jgi:hypothetical protein
MVHLGKASLDRHARFGPGSLARHRIDESVGRYVEPALCPDGPQAAGLREVYEGISCVEMHFPVRSSRAREPPTQAGDTC